jgi:small subunit ribosomal protein S10
MAKKNKIRIKLKSFDYRLIDQAAHDIIETARRTGARVVGPIPMPTKIEKYTVLSSPHVNKKAREQFEMRTHKRFIELLDPTSKTIDSLKNYNLPAGVDITIAA